MLIFRSSRNCFSSHPSNYKNCTAQPTQSLLPYPPWLSNARRLCGSCQVSNMYYFLHLLHIWVCHCLTCSQVLTALYVFWVTSLVYIAKTHNQGAIWGEIIYLCLYLENKAQSLWAPLQVLGGKGQACNGLFAQVGFMVISWYIVGWINHT